MEIVEQICMFTPFSSVGELDMRDPDWIGKPHLPPWIEIPIASDRARLSIAIYSETSFVVAMFAALTGRSPQCKV